jgi:hypothetical protein
MDRRNPKCRGFLGWLLGHNFERPTWQPEPPDPMCWRCGFRPFAKEA